MSESQNKVGVIGAGSWGTAVAHILSRNCNSVHIWSRNRAIIDDINNSHQNTKYFQNAKLNGNIIATNDIGFFYEADYIFLAIPTQSIRDFFKTYSGFKGKVIICSKGIELKTLKFPKEIVEEFIRSEIYIFSGPNFAKEIINNLPAAADLVGNHGEEIMKIASLLNHKLFRTYISNDVLSVQICGAMKNVLAIACGICVGKNFGENAKAALITRGINEIISLIKAMRGDEKTINGLSGIGDIILTCNSTLSRNMSYGMALANNQIINDTTIEGIATAKSVYEICKKYEVIAPIFEEIYNIIHLNLDVDIAIDNLLSRGRE